MKKIFGALALLAGLAWAVTYYFEAERLRVQIRESLELSITNGSPDPGSRWTVS